jgi:hypothetical protein
MNNFWKGVITGAAGMLVLVVLVSVFRFFQEWGKKTSKKIPRCLT